MAVRTITRGPHVALAWPAFDWRLLARRLAYANTDRRDLRLDLLRGFCVFAMIVDHIGGSSWLYALTGGNRWLVSAAEGFVFLSGLTMGFVYREKVRRFGLRGATRAALHRAGTLYLLTVALTLIFTALARLTNLTLWTDRGPASGDPLELLVGALTLHYTYHGADVLALYTLLVAAAPLIFFLLDEGRTSVVVAVSWLLWAAYQVYPEQVAIPWTIRNNAYFPLAAWQVLFINGLVLGWHRSALAAAARQRLAVVRRAPALLSLATPLLALASTSWLGRAELSTLAFDPMTGLFAKPNLGPGRLVLFLAIFATAYLVLTVAWQPINRVVGWLLLPLGQNALYGYTMQLFLLVPLYNLFPVGIEAPEFAAVNSAAQLAAVLLIWAMIKQRFLFSIVPR